MVCYKQFRLIFGSRERRLVLEIFLKQKTKIPAIFANPTDAYYDRGILL